MIPVSVTRRVPTVIVALAVLLLTSCRDNAPATDVDVVPPKIDTITVSPPVTPT